MYVTVRKAFHHWKFSLFPQEMKLSFGRTIGRNNERITDEGFLGGTVHHIVVPQTQTRGRSRVSHDAREM
jgi:hypothetical protein